MKIHWWVTLSLALLLGLSSPAVGAAKGEKVSSKKTTGDKIREVLPESQAVFSEQERVLIKGWFRDNLDGLPPGLAKRETLPPGLEKQLQERGTLPPGLQKKIQPLPVKLERQLRRLPTGYRRVVVAGNVILMNEKTAMIYDIVRSVIP
jgi:hypothetical protein